MEEILVEPVRLTLQQQLQCSQADHPSWSAAQHMAFLEAEGADVQNISIALGWPTPLKMIGEWMSENKAMAEVLAVEKVRAAKLRRELDGVGNRKLQWQRGSRIELVRCTDPYTKLPPGLRGTVSMVDDAGTIHVDWDNGARLGVVLEDGDRIVPVIENET